MVYFCVYTARGLVENWEMVMELVLKGVLIFSFLSLVGLRVRRSIQKARATDAASIAEEESWIGWDGFVYIPSIEDA